MENKDYGIVIQAVGPIIDVRFYDYKLPSILTALRIPLTDDEDLIGKVYHLEETKSGTEWKLCILGTESVTGYFGADFYSYNISSETWSD